MTEEVTDPAEPTPDQLYQHHAGGVYRLMLRQMEACAREYPGNDEAQVSGMMMALVYHYIRQTKAPGQPLIVRDITVALTPVLFRTAETVVDALKEIEKERQEALDIPPSVDQP